MTDWIEIAEAVRAHEAHLKTIMPNPLPAVANTPTPSRPPRDAVPTAGLSSTTQQENTK